MELTPELIHKYFSYFSRMYYIKNKVENDIPNGVPVTVYCSDGGMNSGYCIDVTTKTIGLDALIAKRWIKHDELLAIIENNGIVPAIDYRYTDRYTITNLYPGCPYKVGDTFTLDNNLLGISKHGEILKYEAVIRIKQWWEDLPTSEYPDFVGWKGKYYRVAKTSPFFEELATLRLLPVEPYGHEEDENTHIIYDSEEDYYGKGYKEVPVTHAHMTYTTPITIFPVK